MTATLPPISLRLLGLLLGLLLSACGGGGATEASSSTSTGSSAGSAAGGGSTASVLCSASGSEFNDTASVQLTARYSWTCSSTQRQLTANGVPNHVTGTFPNPDNPNRIAATNVSAAYTLNPTASGSAKAVANVVGHALNGVKFDPATGGRCTDAAQCSLDAHMDGNPGTWVIEALGQTAFRFGVDASNAHVQPTGEYHYHGMPEAYLTKLGKGTATMTLVGWAVDGFPVYARYGYTAANDAGSGVKTLRGSYRVKAQADSGRPSTSVYPMGTFTQDWEYVAGLGDLDECNGRTGVTPEFPNGTYYYAITDSYPFIHRCVKGKT